MAWWRRSNPKPPRRPWVLTSLASVLTAIGAGSAFTYFGYEWRRVQIGADRGQVAIGVYDDDVDRNARTPKPAGGWYFGYGPSTGWRVWPAVETWNLTWRGGSLTVSSLPLWIPIVPISALAAWRWRRYVIWRGRQRVGACRTCGYDLAGLGSVPCPECGSALAGT